MKNIVAMLVKGGMVEAEAVEAVANYTEADYLAEVEAEALEEARWEEEQRLYFERMDDYEYKHYYEQSIYEDADRQGYWEDGEWWAI